MQSPDKKLWEESGGLLIRGSEVRILPGAWKFLQMGPYRRIAIRRERVRGA